MSATTESVLAVMYRDACDAAQYRGLYTRDVDPPAEGLRKSDQSRAAVAELIEADREYDVALQSFKDISRRVNESGWIEVEFDALRKAGEYLMRAMDRRSDALARIGAAP